ncbi:variant erythrocyte surface antigen-1 family protein [Babesia caballi]|uniref:Variant erythrocyte surface antigen-1 family protein n=1 Tax=Babesia caballi TaxID=5871 RepID=A0AAV4LQY6_BABCB|nr:variant erythrocyte surface antigen-1 family protein [Babesia caballi]
MMTAGKSLTEPPNNLKEAIDWVLKIKNDQAIEDIAKALEALLKEEAGDVAVRVQDVFDVIKDNINKKFDKMNGPFCDHYKGHLRSATTGLKAVERPEDVKSDDLKTAIEALVSGLKAFLGYTGSTNFSGRGIIKNPGANYTFTYNTATWIPDDALKCAAIFLGMLPAIFFGVTLTYWKCKNNKWRKLATDTPLELFLTQMGFYKNVLNTQNDDAAITNIKSNWFTELSGNANSNEYTKFLSDLMKKPHTSLASTATTTPLTSLYLLSHYYITYPIYSVQSTSPAIPSFLGYSGLTALAGGAYGFNLGGIGTFMSALLA